MKIRIEDMEVQILVDDPENYSAEASIDIVGKNTVMTYVRMRGLDHHDDGSIMFMKSNDEGRTWDKSTLVAAMTQYDNWGFTSSSVKILKNGKIMVLAHAMVVDSKIVHGANFRGSWSTVSKDGGCTWTTPEPLLGWPMRIINIWDNPIELDDGKLILAVSGHIRDTDVSNSFSDPSRSCVLCSEDSGISWYYRGTIAYDPAGIHRFYEPGMTLTEDGRLIALSRQHYAEYCTSDPAGFLFKSESHDMGASWSGFQQTKIWGFPADAVTLKNGLILTVYGHRRDPQGVRIAISSDGVEWSEDNVFTIYEPPQLPELEDSKGNSMNTGYRHIGYPSAAVRDDGSVVVVFHSFNEDRRQIILSATFRVTQA
jgi:hypothetical protein